MGKTMVLATLLLFAVPVSASAFDRFVNPNDTCPPAQVGGAPEHNTIQEAVDAAAAGDEIGVCPGIYAEGIVDIPSDKTGISLTGLGVVTLRPNQDFPFGFVAGFRVLADDVRIERFTIHGFDSPGVNVLANGADIQNNNIVSRDVALVLFGDGHRVRNNILRATGCPPCSGVSMFGVNGVEIAGNRVSTLVTGCGICAFNLDQTSPGTVIHHNLVSGGLDEGISVTGANGGTIRNNTVRGTPSGSPQSFGIRVSGTMGMTIMLNAVRGAEVGIGVQDSTNCTVGFNSVAFNSGPGIDLSTIEGCLIQRNNISRNNPPDCRWDGRGSNFFMDNNCKTEDPPGAWD